MRHTLAIVAEAARVALAQRVASFVVAALVAGTCIGVLLTAGRTVALEQSVLARIDDAGTRTIIAQTTTGEPMRAAAMDILAATDQVSEVLGLGPIQDSRNALVPAGEPVPVRRAYGSVGNQQLVPTVGGLPMPMGWASMRAAGALGLLDGSGGIITAGGQGLAVRTGLRLPDYLAGIVPLVLIPSSMPGRPSGADPAAPLTRLVIVAASPQDVDAVAALVTDLVRWPGGPVVSVETSAELVKVRQAVGGQLGAFGRSAILGILGLTVILTSSALLALMSNRRRDFGRRRALGAAQDLITALVVLQVAIPAAVGAAAGTAAGVLVIGAQGQPVPGAVFVAALALAAVIAAVLAAVVPALIAARRDPLHELRVP